MTRTDIRLALPSKGILQDGSVELLAACGMKIFRPNPRQYEARIPALNHLSVVFQRPGDIVVGVRQGSVDLAITGLDILREKEGENGDDGRILVLHDSLGFGPCTLRLALPEQSPVANIIELAAWAKSLARDGRTLRIATKFPNLTRQFLDGHHIHPYKLIAVEGTLEIAPAIGFADLIADLVSSGTTLRDNHLRPLEDGLILRSEASLIANKQALRLRPEVMSTARQMLELIEAHLRAEGSYLVIANMRGDSPAAIAEKMASQIYIAGLQGPTIAPVFPNDDQAAESWFAVNIVVRKGELFAAIAELRAIGGSGVIVSPLTYIFEEEPERYRAMLETLKEA